MRSVFTRRFDLDGNELSRLLKIAMFGKIVPIGNLRGGPGARCLAVLALLHYMGYPLYWINARYGHRLNMLRRLMTKIRRR